MSPIYPSPTQPRLLFWEYIKRVLKRRARWDKKFNENVSVRFGSESICKRGIFISAIKMEQLLFNHGDKITLIIPFYNSFWLPGGYQTVVSRRCYLRFLNFTAFPLRSHPLVLRPSREARKPPRDP